MIKFFLMPVEVWYYVVIPIVIILLVYFIFWLFYHKKKGSYYYNYVVDYVYSTLGIVFCALLLSLLLGYSIATIQVIFEAELIQKYFFLVVVLMVLPIVPACFLVYVLKIYIRNLKRKKQLDLALENAQNKDNPSSNEFAFGKDNDELPQEPPKFEESEFELKKKKK